MGSMSRHCKCTREPKSPNLMPGWMCCNCHEHHLAATYNNLSRERCKYCGHHRPGLYDLPRPKPKEEEHGSDLQFM